MFQRVTGWIAPRGPIDFTLKLAFWQLLIGSMNYLRDTLEHPLTHDTLWDNILEASFVALPFSILVLALIWHMQKLQGQLVTLATTDLLTNLPNRRFFLERLDAMVGREDVTLLMIDVDHFKQVNDTFGHPVGDQCLVAMGEHLSALCGHADTVARLGGEEFGMLLVSDDPQAVVQVGQQIAAGISLPVGEPETIITVTNSIGAVNLAQTVPATELMRRADMALYKAKAAGRARMCVAAEMKAASQEKSA